MRGIVRFLLCVASLVLEHTQDLVDLVATEERSAAMRTWPKALLDADDLTAVQAVGRNVEERVPSGHAVALTLLIFGST